MVGQGCSRSSSRVTTNIKTVLRTPIHDRRLKRGQALVVLICLGFSLYFAYHAIYGRHGLEARHELLERQVLLEFEHKSLEAVRAKLRRDVALLTPELPDTDLVEETARDVLGFVHPDDQVLVRRR